MFYNSYVFLMLGVKSTDIHRDVLLKRIACDLMSLTHPVSKCLFSVSPWPGDSGCYIQTREGSLSLNPGGILCLPCKNACIARGWGQRSQHLPLSPVAALCKLFVVRRA